MQYEIQAGGPHASGQDRRRAHDRVGLLQRLHGEGQVELDVVVLGRDGLGVDKGQQLLRVDQGQRAVLPERRIRFLRRARACQ